MNILIVLRSQQWQTHLKSLDSVVSAKSFFIDLQLLLLYLLNITHYFHQCVLTAYSCPDMIADLNCITFICFVKYSNIYNSLYSRKETADNTRMHWVVLRKGIYPITPF